ncbi:MAG: hypothetical protein KDA60_07675 [Planctomycetales bacterium]|nr:hypothetical protein [Planctomycetales bacterium]
MTHCPVPLGGLFASYSSDRLHGCSKTTTRDYGYIVNCFDGWFTTNTSYADMAPEAILSSYTSYLSDEGRSSATVNKHVRLIKALWCFAHEQELLRRIRAGQELSDALPWSSDEPADGGDSPAWMTFETNPRVKSQERHGVRPTRVEAKLHCVCQ